MDFVLKKELENSKYKFVEIIKTNKLNELRSKIDKTKGLVIVEGGLDNINRAAVENKKVDILLSPEKGRLRDHTHYRDSGLNQVLCKLAYQNKISIGINFSGIYNSKHRDKLLAKIKQNIRFCRKYKVNMVIGSFSGNKEEIRSKDELQTFARALGITPGDAKIAVNFKRKN